MVASTASSGGDPCLEPGSLPTDVRLISQFLIGGVVSTMGAVLQDDLNVDRDHLLDVLVALFEAVSAVDPARAAGGR